MGGDTDPGQTDDLCFKEEKKSIYVAIGKERIRRRNEVDNLIVLLSYLLLRES